MDIMDILSQEIETLDNNELVLHNDQLRKEVESLLVFIECSLGRDLRPEEIIDILSDPESAAFNLFTKENVTWN